MQAAPERLKLVNGDRYVYVDSEASEAAWNAKGFHREGAVAEAAPASPAPPAPKNSGRGKRA